MGVIAFIGAYAYARRVLEAMPRVDAVITTWQPERPRWEDLYRVRPEADYWVGDVRTYLRTRQPDLIVVAGWRRRVPIMAPTVGFHSARLPEYPGRAPVPNAILRGDPTLTNTMLWLDDGTDSGDIIDEWEFPITGRDPDDIYGEIGETSALMLKRHWEGLIDGTAPRRPQDMSRRGEPTPADAWERL